MTIDRLSAATTRSRQRARLSLLGALLLLLAAAGCVNKGAASGPFPSFSEYEGDKVEAVDFQGKLVLPLDSLRAVLTIHPPVCRVSFLPGWACFVGKNVYHLDLVDLASDVVRLQLYYRDHGYYGTRVIPGVEPTGSDAVKVEFAVLPGDEVILTQLQVEGMDSIVPTEQLKDELPLQVGGPFGRLDFLASADTIRSELFRRGYAYAEVLRNYGIDTVTDAAEVSYQVVHGPLVHVDSILVLGTDRLDRGTVLRELTLHEGDLLRLPELSRSQRNLYNLSIVNYASVTIAPDSMQVDADSSEATLAVRIVEAPKYRLDASAGFGTVDCLRAGVQLTDRDFIGGGRTLQLSAATSKIGAGDVLNLGNLCNPYSSITGSGALGQDISEALNYRFAADFLQPRLLGTGTQLSANLHLVQQSELALYLRRSAGGQVQLSRELLPNVVVGAGLQVEHGTTDASKAIQCVVFASCNPEGTPGQGFFFSNPRWSNVATLSAAWNRSSTVGGMARGFTLSSALAWSSPVLRSADRYLSVIGEAVGYYPLAPGWTLAGHLQAGTFLTGSLGSATQYIPPERRFYAGGPNSVRGFPINGLGPQAYVASPTINYDENGNIRNDNIQRYPLGGTRVIVGSAEIRAPSPWMSQYLRLAAFVDAGQVWAPGLSTSDQGVSVPSGHLVVTPGLGVRITTPVGPIRLDVGYNPYATRPGPLYQAPVDAETGQPTGDLILIEPEFRPSPGAFLSRLQFQLAVGQAF
ncbi:MAG TPA: BamA/TamA family outer membrane protein [Longimicrobiaceae bacterium]|nr:BamA/TamA family outer membrane protein [Longimicrobiaceae bacterium]